MATITYQCNVCKRVISKQENKFGLTVFGKCIITDGCHGQLYTLSRNIDNTRETFPFTDGLTVDYSPRKAFYEHTQTVLSKTWVITHKLSTSPAISVYVIDIDGNYRQLAQDDFTIVVVDKNHVNLLFNEHFTGKAQCIARSISTKTPVVTMSTAQTKVTNNGILTMAIPELIVGTPPLPNVTMDVLPFGLDIKVQRPNEQELVSIQNIDSSVSKQSPWNDWSKIIVRKRKNYVVRTLNIYSLFVFGVNVKPTDIPNGTQFKFENISFPGFGFRPIESRELLLLLSNSPYASIDKVKNKVIDVGEMIGAPINYFTYKEGELYISTSMVETTYPDIVKVS